MPSTPEQRDRQRQAYALHLAGLSYQEISEFKGKDGKPLYADSSGAYRGVKAYVERLGQGDVVAEQRFIEMQRFDALQRAVWRKAVGGDLQAAKFALQVMQARQRMLGLQGMQAHESVDDPLDELASRREKKVSGE